jgi:hypothetical protein
MGEDMPENMHYQLAAALAQILAGDDIEVSDTLGDYDIPAFYSVQLGDDESELWIETEEGERMILSVRMAPKRQD